MPGYELIGKEEKGQIDEVFKNGGVLFRHGFDALRNNTFKVREFEDAFAKKMKKKYALAVTSGTAALRVALAAIGIKPGDEVITQCFTFVATVEAIIESGARPVCTEIDMTLNMDPKSLEKLITKQTKAVIVVHMLGTPARLMEIKKICKERGIILIEDTAWGCGGSLGGRALGTFGDIGTFSFDYAKTMTTGEGGMILFKDKATYKKAYAWHDHGHENNPKYPRWEDTRSSSGFNFRMMELQGAIGLAQLEKLDKQRKNEQAVWSSIADLQCVQKREAPKNSFITADALIFLLKSSGHARRCRLKLNSLGISTKILPEAFTWHFAGSWDHMPELIAGSKIKLINRFPISEGYLSRAISLPISIYMSNNVGQRVRKAILESI
jgi:8-amino-3,8-dideoxy-alpha-D-manno-octulosonate transaminase